MAQLPLELLNSLPENDDEAFLVVEDYARRDLHIRLDKLGENDSGLDAELSYMSRVLAAVHQYDIFELSHWKLPARISEYAYRECVNFRDEVGHIVVQRQLGVQRRERKLSVRLDLTDKTKLRQLLEQMRKIVDDADLVVGKKERLYARIHDLQEEIDRDRTRLAQVGAFVIEVMAIAKECDPALRIAERIAGMLGKSKQTEDEHKLPAPAETKRIEPPKTGEPEIAEPKKHSSFDRDLDAEIPF